ncbi:hypothetical protein ACO2Q1_14365 [Brevundimonas sp. VNH65]|uniref:hypothetical protein n=1 Tax=Brevundimonas sp. VNH65 TaxID=3400917 RepID=UPI003C114517
MGQVVSATVVSVIAAASVAAYQPAPPTPPPPDAVRLERSAEGFTGVTWWIDALSIERVGDRATYWELSPLHMRERRFHEPYVGYWTQMEVDCARRMERQVVKYGIDGDLRLGAARVAPEVLFHDRFYPTGGASARKTAFACTGVKPFPDSRSLSGVGAALLMAGMVR